MRRTRTDSADAAVAAAKAVASGPIDPPAHVKLRECDRPFWDSIVSARARDSWNTSDLEVAANVARAKADIERLTEEIQTEGDIVTNDRGTQIINPKHTLLETLTRRVMAGSRMLHVHAEATNGESREQRGKNAAQKDAEKAGDAQQDEAPLIPGLRAVR